MKRSSNATQIACHVQRLGNSKRVLGRVSRCYHHSSSLLRRFQTLDDRFGKVQRPRHTTRSCCIGITVLQSSKRFFSSDTTTTSQHYDPYDRFRNGTLTDDVWREIQEENERTRRSVDPQLYEQVLGEILHAMESIPPPIPELGPTGNFAYSFYDEPTRNRRSYRRQPSWSSAATGPFQTVVDISALDDNLLAMSLSVDETLVAYLLDRQPNSAEGGGGSKANGRRNMLLARHIDSETEIQIEISPNGDGDGDGDISSVELGPLQTDGVGRHSLFYVTNDAKGRPAAVWACTVAWDDDTRTLRQDSNPILLKRFTNPKIMASVQRTKGCLYVNIQGTTKTDNEVFLCRDVFAHEPLQLIMPRQDGVMYHVDAGDDDTIYMLISRDEVSLEDQSLNATASTGIEYSLWKTSFHSLPVQATAENFGKLFASDESGYAIYDMDIFKNFIACYERSKTDGSQRIRLLRHKTSCAEAQDNTTNVISPMAIAQENCATISPGGNIHFHANSIRFVIESPADPPRSYEYDINNECLRLISDDDTQPIPANIQKEKVLVTSQDGTAVPLSLVYRETAKSAAKMDTKQVVLFGYGSYGEPMDLSFNPCLQPLLNRGFVLAYCHSRGGGDLGRSWYHKGRLYCKHKAIEDFIACAEALSSSSLRISEPRKIVAKGFSAGGVLIGAAVNQRPELFGTVVMTNAFLDVRKTMMQENLFLTEHEYDEYGDPIKDPKVASLISSYCPVSNADEKEKNIRFLIIGAFDDVQVPFWNTIIYGKKIRKASRKGSDVLVHIESHGGHNMQIHVAALETAFIIGTRAAYYGIQFEE